MTRFRHGAVEPRPRRWFLMRDNETGVMEALREIESLLQVLSRGEKAQILKWVVQDIETAYPGIDSKADVCGGEPCIVRTRIPVWLLEQARRLGTSEQALLAAYPSLRAEDLVNAWAYARSHTDEIEGQIRANESDSATTQFRPPC